ncbi:unnamed protein product, partial [Rotaria sordida]
MYRCEKSSKCISKQRLLDGIPDCPFDDDETFNQSCSLNDIRQRFRCSNDNNEKCFASLVIQDGKKDCKYGEDESNKKQQMIEKHIYFQTICDGITELLPVLIDGKNETDETQCHDWPCNNTYSRCDQFWLCKDGADEVNCPSSTCPELYHECVFPNDTSKVSCLPITKVNNGVYDCLGGTDERRRFADKIYRDQKIFFKLHNIPTYPSQLTTDNTSMTSSIRIKTDSIQDNPIIKASVFQKWSCNRGMPIRLRMGDNTSMLSCLCPPSYYGDQCQYQNQRVSLTLGIRVTSDWRSVLIVLITLIDDERNAESHDHIQYLPIRDCD